ncbi:phosphotransferase [Nocardioides anomalus]|uniref:Phosphotransferase n=1 Tax=Nocardioides anomalus TaxID=2712223 RepID=A0A6G6WJA1_9ACTN|nr:phosphotransferase [Nocardioides anomalus]QIG45140.1 phosphotransferase [Nocardioides anomalus]
MSPSTARDLLLAELGRGASAAHRPNHAGIGKLSFACRVGATRLWARVAADPDEDQALTTWSRVAGALAERHHAPPVLEVLEVGGRTTLLFPYVYAPVATHGALRIRRDEARTVLDRLHADVALADQLGAPSTTAACFTAVWLDRFTADLGVVEGFVPPDVHAYLADEVADLAERVAALDTPAAAAVHGDPWPENWLAGPDRLWLLDWEDLAVGDPVLDEAVLLHHTGAPWPAGPAHDVARRALLLDDALDVAADWVEASDPTVRRAKEAAYLRGLEAYRAALS